MQNPYSPAIIEDPEHYRQCIAAQKEHRLVDPVAAPGY
jgi:hypothetical protein